MGRPPDPVQYVIIYINTATPSYIRKSADSILDLPIFAFNGIAITKAGSATGLVTLLHHSREDIAYDERLLNLIIKILMSEGLVGPSGIVYISCGAIQNVILRLFEMFLFGAHLAHNAIETLYGRA